MISRRILCCAPNALATLDLSNETQRRLHALVQRMHSGPKPTLRALSMRQKDGVLYEAAQWACIPSPSYSLIVYRPDGHGLSWRNARSKSAVLSALRAL